MRKKHWLLLGITVGAYVLILLGVKHSLSAEHSNALLYNEHVEITETESADIAKKFKLLAESRLIRSYDSVSGIADELLDADSKQRFMAEYKDYLSNVGAESDYIIIEKQYTEAGQIFTTLFDKLKSTGYLTDSGDLTDKAVTKTNTTSASTGATQESSTQVDSNVYSFETDFSDIPQSKDELVNYVEKHTFYVGDGEEVVEANENRELPFMLLGYTSIYTGDTVGAISRAQFDSATYEDMVSRAKQIISLSNSDFKQYTQLSDSFDSRSDAEKESDIAKSREVYQQYQAYADKENFSDEGDDTEELTSSEGSALYDYNFKEPKTSDLVKQNDQGQHVVYWADLKDRIGQNVSIKLFEQDYTLELSKYVVPMSLFSSREYSLDSYEYFISPLEDTDYKGRLSIQLSSKDKRDYVLKTELKVSSDGKIALSDKQIKDILTE